MIQKDGVDIEMLPDTGNEPGTPFRRVTFSQKKSFSWIFVDSYI